MTHSHGAADMAVSTRTRRSLAVGAALLAGATFVALFAIGFGAESAPSVDGVLAGEVFGARVVGAEAGACAGTLPDEGIECTLVTVRLTQGPHRGEERTLEFAVDAPTSPDLSAGDRVVVSYTPGAAEGYDYQFADRERRSVLWAAAALFALAVVLLGRARGLAALGGLVASLVVVLWFVLPAILDGHQPVLVAVVGSSAIAFIALYLAHGFNVLTTVALLGTLAALALIVALSALFTALARFSGFASEEAVLVGQLASRVDVNGLVLAGVVIGALGALDDVTVTQAAAVAELRSANRRTSRGELYRAGLRIGRDHVASAVNTLALAYAGAALPVLLLFVLAGQSLGTVANSEVIATEIVRALVGSVGLVVAVPVTTWLAVLVASPETRAGDDHATGEDASRVEDRPAAEGGEREGRGRAWRRGEGDRRSDRRERVRKIGRGARGRGATPGGEPRRKPPGEESFWS